MPVLGSGEKQEKKSEQDVSLSSSVTVNGESLQVGQLIAIVESLQVERPDLFWFLKSFQSSQEEMREFYRQMIRDDYENYAREREAGKSSAPPVTHGKLEMIEEPEYGSVLVNLPPPPPGEVPVATRMSSLEEALAVAKRIEEEEAAKEQAEVEALAKRLEEEDMMENRRRAELFYCEICMDDEATVNGSITLDCDHRFCEDCLSGFICSKIESREVSEEELKCPRVDCTYCISHATIRGCTEGVGKAKVYEKFLTFTTDKYLESSIEDGGAMRCPNDKCDFVFQWRPNGSSFAFTCAKCSGQYCLNCALVGESGRTGGIGPGHAPLSCEQQREKMELEVEEKRKFDDWQKLNAKANELFDEMIKSNGWRKCPHCTSAIERTQGCDHMTCTSCKCNFCYVCGKYDSNHPKRRGDCGMTCPKRGR